MNRSCDEVAAGLRAASWSSNSSTMATRKLLLGLLIGIFGRRLGALFGREYNENHLECLFATSQFVDYTTQCPHIDFVRKSILLEKFGRSLTRRSSGVWSIDSSLWGSFDCETDPAADNIKLISWFSEWGIIVARLMVTMDVYMLMDACHSTRTIHHNSAESLHSFVLGLVGPLVFDVIFQIIIT